MSGVLWVGWLLNELEVLVEELGVGLGLGVGVEVVEVEEVVVEVDWVELVD